MAEGSTHSDIGAQSTSTSYFSATIETSCSSLAPSASLTIQGEVPPSSTLSRYKARRTKDFWILPIPRRLQYDPAKPFTFGLPLNVAFAIATAIGSIIVVWDASIMTNKNTHQLPETFTTLNRFYVGKSEVGGSTRLNPPLVDLASSFDVSEGTIARFALVLGFTIAVRLISD